MPFPSELRVLSAVIYPPRAENEPTRIARNFVLERIKGDRIAFDGATVQAIEYTVGRLLDHLPATTDTRYFDGVEWLVPLPGHSLYREGALWPSLRIANALLDAGVGNHVCSCIRRVVPVPKSAWASPGERPTPRTHYESFRVEPQLIPPPEVLLVDDVVTRGSTMIGASARLMESFPELPRIRAFSIARTERVTLNRNADMFAPLKQTITYDEQSDSAVRA